MSVAIPPRDDVAALRLAAKAAKAGQARRRLALAAICDGGTRTNAVRLGGVIPANITSLPPRVPELNLVETVWQFLRDDWLSDRVSTSCEDIVDRCCEAWNGLTEQPGKISSIGPRDWAHRS